MIRLKNLNREVYRHLILLQDPGLCGLLYRDSQDCAVVEILGDVEDNAAIG